MKSLLVNDLYFSYTDAFIFEHLNFEIHQGEGCILLAGQNGAGKSTLLDVLCGLLNPDAGSIERGSMTIAYLPFENPLYSHLTILENLRYFYRCFQ